MKISVNCTKQSSERTTLLYLEDALCRIPELPFPATPPGPSPEALSPFGSDLGSVDAIATGGKGT